MSALTPDETILGLLAVQPRHGYDLLECFHSPEHLGRVWDLSTSQLYNVLKRLEHRGWISGRQIETDNAPPRTEYAITPFGDAYLRAWLHEAQPASSIRRIRVEFLSRLYIARALHLSIEPLVIAQRMACRCKRDELTSERKHAHPGIDMMALDLHIAQLDAVLQWIDRVTLAQGYSTNVDEAD